MSAIGPGDLVEYIGSNREFLTPGRIYTVLGFDNDCDCNSGDPSIFVVEHRERPDLYTCPDCRRSVWGEASFWLKNFRPIRRDELQIFRDMVAKPKVDA